MATRASGFTIIETMLFLAISGLLLVGLIAGVGSSINVQRYNDSAQTFKNSIQDQYAAVTSVQNSRPNNWTCTSTGRVVERPAGDASADLRGQSACVMLGRYITIRNTDIDSYLVTAYANPAPTPGLNDIESLRQNYAINVAQTNMESSQLEWGARIAWPVEGPYARLPGTSRSMAVLIVRSPESGQVYTFTTNSVPAKSAIEAPGGGTPAAYLRDMIIAGDAVPGQGNRLICIEPNGLGIGHRTALRINSFASAPNAIELESNEQLESSGTQC
jgi:type II secretory pathway pseudopilin PulG